MKSYKPANLNFILLQKDNFLTNAYKLDKFLTFTKKQSMKQFLLLALFLIGSACQTIKIEDKNYKISKSTTELGSIGLSQSLYLSNNFSTRIFPLLENKIRVDVKILPFNKKLNKYYLKKGYSNQNQSKIQYVDSLALKPEFVVVSILDVGGFINEINAEYNKETTNYLKSIKTAKVVTSIATIISAENLNKIKQADAFYLTNNQDKKYTLSLYKLNKKLETIDLQSGVVIAYELGKCCWAIDKKGKWYLGDISNNQSCNGETYSNTNKKYEEKNLLKL